MTTICEGIIIGGAGGTFAGFSIFLMQLGHEEYKKRRDCNLVYQWLRKNIPDSKGHKFRSTRSIASPNNLTEDRVRYICSVDERILLSTGETEDLWGIR